MKKKKKNDFTLTWLDLIDKKFDGVTQNDKTLKVFKPQRLSLMT